jgi:hypothetical protein
LTSNNSIQNFSYNQERALPSTTAIRRNNLLANLPNVASYINEGASFNDESQNRLTSNVAIKTDVDEIVAVADTSQTATTKNKVLSKLIIDSNK